jgi:hypothetical protein
MNPEEEVKEAKSEKLKMVDMYKLSYLIATLVEKKVLSSEDGKQALKGLPIIGDLL